MAFNNTEFLEFKEIPGYSGRYAINTYGSVLSLPKEGGTRFGSIFIPQENLDGYHRVCLLGKTVSVHRLVAKTFIVRERGKDCINHKDGNKQNNHVSNLEWCTPKENAQHAVRIGLFNTQRRNKANTMNAINRKKFSDIQANKIREIKKETGCSMRSLARLFSCSNTAISNVIYKKAKYV